VLEGVGQNLQDHSLISLKIQLNLNTTATVSHHTLPSLTNSNVENQLEKFFSPTSPIDRMDSLFGYTVYMGQAFLSSKFSSASPDLHFELTQTLNNGGHDDGNKQDFSLRVKSGLSASIGVVGFNTTAYLRGERKATKLALMDQRFFTDLDRVDSKTMIYGRFKYLQMQIQSWAKILIFYLILQELNWLSR
jgi:hypothetical protein